MRSFRGGLEGRDRSVPLELGARDSAGPSWLRPLAARPALIAALFVGAVVLFLVGSTFTVLQSDTYLLLYSGRYVADHGVPHHEVFALAAAGHAYANQQWLSGLLEYEIWRLGGYPGMAIVSLLAFGGGYVVLARMMMHRGASFAVSVSCGILAVFGALSLVFIRAQDFAVPLFVALLWLCLDDHRRDRPHLRLVVLVPMLALWANLHGSVLLGLVLACGYLITRACLCARAGRRRDALVYLGLAGGCALTTFATPYGVQILDYYRALIGNSAVGVADIEWDPPALGQLSFYQFALPLLLSAAAVTAGWLRGRRPAWPLIGAVVITGAAASTAMRNNVWLDITGAVLIAECARGVAPHRELASRRPPVMALAATLLAAIGLGGAVVAHVATTTTAAFEGRTSMAAMRATALYVTAHPCARILADGVSSDALLWFDPALAGRIGFDGELEVFPQRALIDWQYFQAHYSAGWLDAARGYDVLVGSSQADPALAAALARLPGARTLSSDAAGIAVARPGSAGACPSASRV